ncbi:MAG: hypothetical protein ACNA8W_25910, partial [Bradymonadaceae bacterium]
AVSPQLSGGKIGIIGAALALGLPIIPIGISGCREAFKGESPASRGGTIKIRFGAPITIDPAPYGANFRPFHPDDEETYRLQLQVDTDRIMEHINNLIEPQYQWAPDAADGGKVGVARFY